MRLEYIGLSELSGSLIALEGVKNVAYDEMAEGHSGERGAPLWPRHPH